MDCPLTDPLEFSQDFFRTELFQRHKPNHCALFDHSHGYLQVTHVAFFRWDEGQSQSEYRTAACIWTSAQGRPACVFNHRITGNISSRRNFRTSLSQPRRSWGVTNEEAERKCRDNPTLPFKCSSYDWIDASLAAHPNIARIQTKGNISPNNIEVSKKSEITTLKSKWQTLKFNLSRNESLACISKRWMLQKLLIATVRWPNTRYNANVFRIH